MKKLMIAAAIVCAAVVSQAATCTWGSGAMKTAAGEDGGWSKTAVTGIEVAMNVYFIDKSTFDDLSTASQKDLFDAYNGGTADLTGTNWNGSKYIGAITIEQSNSPAADQYAVAIATYTDATYGDMYMATLATGKYNEGSGSGSATGIMSGVANWQAAAVPEPTSGLLLLLGVAGLALRRRRA